MPAKLQDVNPAFFSPPWQSLSRSKWYQMVPAVSDWHPSKQSLHSQGRTTAADEGCGCGAQESCQCVWPPGWDIQSTQKWLEPWVCSVCTHTIDHLYWCITSYIIWLYMVVYGCIWLFQWEHENHPLVLWGSPIDAPSVVARRQGPLFWEWKFGGLRNGRTPELEKSGFDSIYIYIFVKHLLNIYKDDLCMIQNHIQILKQNSLDGIF